nr:hypothetical protein [Marinobacter sp. DS40M8]
MSDQSSLLVEKLWRLKRRIDKGQCPSVDFVHLNVLLREPNYRNDVLMRVEANGTPELQALAREIMANDDGRPLMAKSSNQKLQASPVTPQKKTRLVCPSCAGTGSRYWHGCRHGRRFYRI